MGPTRVGSSSRNRMYGPRAPRLRAASTNSRSRRDSVWPRMIRPMYGQAKKPITKTSSPIRSEFPDSPNADDGMTPTSAIANTSSGKARKMSIARAITLSTQPPKNPAITPITMPMPTASAADRNAMISDARAPLTPRASRSRPVIGSTPNGCAALIPPSVPYGRLNVGSIRFSWYVSGFCTRYGPKIATRMRKITTMPPAMATLSWRSRIQAICPRDRPSIALPATAGAGVGSGPPGPVATSIGTAIVNQSVNRGRGVHARLIPERSENPQDASAGVRSSEIALFPAQVPDPSRTRSLIVTKVAPICHRALRSGPLMVKLRLILTLPVWLDYLFVGFAGHRTPNRLADRRDRQNFGSGDAVATQDIRDVAEVVVIVVGVPGLTALRRRAGRARGGSGGGLAGGAGAGRQLPAGRRILAQRPGAADPGLGGLLVLVPADSAPAQRAGHHEQHHGHAGQRDPRPPP